MKISILLTPYFASRMYICTATKTIITASQAKNYIGKTVIASDKIHEARLDDIFTKEVNILYTGTDYNHCTLALVFPKNMLQKFTYNPNSKMINNTFRATGKMEIYKEKPVIYINNKGQLNTAGQNIIPTIFTSKCR